MNHPPGESPAPARPKSPRANRHARRWLPYVGALVVVAAIVVGLWPQPIPIETAVAAVGTLRATVNEEGKTRIKQRFLISAPVTGQLRRIPFKAGAEVLAQKTVLAVIDPVSPALLDARARTLAEARRDAAVANLDKARAARTWAASELRRFEQLAKGETVSPQDLEAVRVRATTAAGDEAAAQSALRQAEAELAQFDTATENPNSNSTRPPREVTAPCNGRVLRVFEENSRVVTAGTLLLEIGDPSDLEVVIEVLSRDGAVITPGMKVQLEQWGGAEPLSASVRLIEPAAFTKISALGVEEQRVRIIADLLTPPEKRPGVGDNFRVEARIIVWETNDTLRVPSATLFRRSDQWSAFVVTEGRAHLKSVKTGRSSGVETQVLEGLKAGDELILYPGNRVKDGARIRKIKF